MTVSGSFVRVTVDGIPRCSLRRATGVPVEGTVVFGLRRGIARFEEPTVQRHRTLGPDRVSPEERFDEPLRLDRPLTFPWATVSGRRVEGIPADPRGTLLLWFPEALNEDAWERGRLVPQVAGVRSAVLGPWTSYPQTVVLLPEAALSGPARWVSGALDVLDVDAVAGHAGHPEVARIVKAFEDEVPASANRDHPYPVRPVWIAVDATNVIRSCWPDSSPAEAASLFHSLAGR